MVADRAFNTKSTTDAFLGYPAVQRVRDKLSRQLFHGSLHNFNSPFRLLLPITLSLFPRSACKREPVAKLDAQRLSGFLYTAVPSAGPVSFGSILIMQTVRHLVSCHHCVMLDLFVQVAYDPRTKPTLQTVYFNELTPDMQPVKQVTGCSDSWAQNQT